MLSEMSEKERQIPYDITYVESKKQTSEYNKKERNSQITPVVTSGEREAGGVR